MILSNDPNTLLAQDLESLLEIANRIREEHFGNAIQTCMIVNARCGTCENDCKFCSQSAHYDTGVKTFPLLEKAQMLAESRIAVDAKASHFGIVTAGPTVAGEELDRIVDTVREIRQSGKIMPCASLGQLDSDSLQRLKDAGLKRYHHNLETSESFYPSICSTQSWRNRYDTVKRAMDVGLSVCSGTLFGLGETWQDRIDLAITLKSLGVTSVPMNFLHAIPGTPLENIEPLSSDDALRIIAIYRHILPEVTLRICGGRPKILDASQLRMFYAGANALMTGNYLTTSGITPQSDREMVEALNLRWT